MLFRSRLVDLTYSYSDEQIFPNVERITEAFVLPSAASPVVGGTTQPSTFTLPGAAGIGFAGIVPGTLRGTLRLEGNDYPFVVESRSGNRLVFGGGRPTGVGDPVGLEYVLRTGGSKLKSVRGSVDLATGVISLTFASGEDWMTMFSPSRRSIDWKASYIVCLPATLDVRISFGRRNSAPGRLIRGRCRRQSPPPSHRPPEAPSYRVVWTDERIDPGRSGGGDATATALSMRRAPTKRLAQ